MKKYILDYGDLSHFKGLRIFYPYLEEGLAYALEENIKDIAVWGGENTDRQTVDFGFLKEFQHIKTFHWTVSLSKKSNLDGLSNLTNLKNFAWAVDNNFGLDLSLFPNLEKMNLRYSDKMKNWGSLKFLKFLQLGKVTSPTLDFLSPISSLDYLRIIGGKFTTVEGIENNKNLETLFLQKCPSLEVVFPILKKLPNLTQLNLESCKKIKDIEAIKSLNIKHISII